MSLRLRLTLLYVVLLAIGLTAFGLTVYLIASRSIYNSVDDGLAMRAVMAKSGSGPGMESTAA